MTWVKLIEKCVICGREAREECYICQNPMCIECVIYYKECKKPVCFNHQKFSVISTRAGLRSMDSYCLNCYRMNLMPVYIAIAFAVIVFLIIGIVFLIPFFS